MCQISQETFKDAPTRPLILRSQSITKQDQTPLGVEPTPHILPSQYTMNHLTDSQDSSMSEKSLDSLNDRHPRSKQVKHKEAEEEDGVTIEPHPAESRPTKHPKKESRRKQTTLGSFFMKKQ
jgi:hypothetical protein